jgi:autotransporter-associated beta strand protein
LKINIQIAAILMIWSVVASAELITVENITNYSGTNTPAGSLVISGDSDVSTNGVLVEAVNFGSVSNGFTWINGVPFKNISPGTNGAIAGDFLQVVGANQVAVTGLGTSSAPFAGLSTNYQALLQEGTTRNTGYINYLQCNYLIPGEQYEIQIWLNDSRSNCANYAASTFSLKEGNGNGFVYLQSGSYVTNTGDMKLSKDNSLVPGGLGSYFLGTFMATDTPPNGGAINILLEPGSLINAAQIRRLPVISASTPVSHPRLLVTTNMYLALRGRVSTTPFSTLFSQVSGGWNRGLILHYWDSYSQLLTAATLGYMLDTNIVYATQARYASNVLYVIDYFHNNELSTLDASQNSLTVYPATPVLNMILALDVMHDDIVAGRLAGITPAQLYKAENEVSEIVEWYRHMETSWTECKYGLTSTWDIYKGISQRDITNSVIGYTNIWLGVNMKPDGAYAQSPGYLSARTGMERNAKHWPMDVLQFTGNFPFYSDPVMKGLMTYLGCFTFTPFGANQIYGDTVSSLIQDTTQDTILSKMALYNNGDITSDDARHGQWLLNLTGGATLANAKTAAFMLYVTLPTNYSAITPEMPVSALMSDYGAALWGRTNSTNALMGTLMSYSDPGGGLGTHDAGHNHYDADSIHIVGYGEHLLFNSGAAYNPTYPGVCPDGGAWNRAWLQNNVVIGTQSNYVNIDGSGLTNGLVGGNIEFGRTGSGRAISNGTHYRSLVFMQPSAGTANGYFALLDEVNPTNSADPIKINLHPNTVSNLTTVTLNQEYYAPVNGVHNNPANGAGVSIFYGTAPTAVNMQVGWHGTVGYTNFGYNATAGCFTNKYLEAVYSAGNDGWLRTTTVLFPQDATHVKATMARVSGTGYTGVSVAHGGGINDYVLQSDDSSLLANKGVQWQGNGLAFRNNNGVVSSYLLMRGRSFRDGTAINSGFAANADVSTEMDGSAGSVESPGTPVTFFYTNSTGVLLDGTVASAIAVGGGGFQVQIPAGRHNVAMVLSSSNHNLTWAGDGAANNWDVQSSANWLNGGSAYYFYQGDNVMFDDTGPSTPAINLTTALAPGSMTVNATHNYTFSGSGYLVGAMSLTKSGTGTLTLSGANTYTGGTTIRGGTLLVNGSIGTNTVIVQTGATLGGIGTITGSLTSGAGATVSPGINGGIGRLTVAANAVLNGITLMKLNRNAATNDVMSVGGKLTYDGTLSLTNLSGTLAATDTFKLFNAASYSGGFGSITPATPGTGLAWNTINLTVNGTIGIVSTLVPTPRITGISLSGTTLTITATNGPLSGRYVLLQSTNMAMPLNQWAPVLTNNFDGSGNLNLSTNIVNPKNTQAFYILSQ